MMPGMVEVVDGLLASEDNVIMKARGPELFPENVRGYFQDKTKVLYRRIEKGLDTVTVKVNDKRAVFNVDLFNYADNIAGRVDYYLSNIPLPGEDGEYYPLFAKYRHGWVVISPMGA